MSHATGTALYIAHLRSIRDYMTCLAIIDHSCAGNR